RDVPELHHLQVGVGEPPLLVEDVQVVRDGRGAERVHDHDGPAGAGDATLVQGVQVVGDPVLHRRVARDADLGLALRSGERRHARFGEDRMADRGHGPGRGQMPGGGSRRGHGRGGQRQPGEPADRGHGDNGPGGYPRERGPAARCRAAFGCGAARRPSAEHSQFRSLDDGRHPDMGEPGRMTCVRGQHGLVIRPSRTEPLSHTTTQKSIDIRLFGYCVRSACVPNCRIYFAPFVIPPGLLPPGCHKPARCPVSAGETERIEDDVRTILVAGGGYAGFYTAWRLEKNLRRDQARIVVVDPRPYMTYQPFLPEVVAGSVEARHAAVSLRRHLRRASLVAGTVTAIDHAHRTVTVHPAEGPDFALGYDIIVVTAGAVTRRLAIPGVAEQAIGMKHVEEAVAIRDRLLTAFDRASTLEPGPLRRRLLTVTFIGGGFSGVEG